MKTRFFKTDLPTPNTLVRLLALGLLACAMPSYAATVALGFACISNNNASSCATGEQQLHAELSQSTVDTATFAFSNIGANASVIGQIYFDDRDNLLGSITTLSFGDYGRVSFSERARSANLPGGRSRAVGFLADFSLGAANPSPKNGLNNGAGSDFESLSVTFLLGSDFGSLRSALARGELRLGIHAQAFAGGFSESFVNQPSTVVPIPATVWLFATGLIGFVGIARRRADKSAPADFK